jgi:RimJ/RimL family protein N-acetyltransferase
VTEGFFLDKFQGMNLETFKLQPTLSGHLITLRPLVPRDFEALYQCASDPLIWEQHPQSNRFEKNIFQGFFDGAVKSGGALVAVENRSGKIIGSSRYYDLLLEKKRVTVGYTFLTRPYWGGKFNWEMKSLMLTHAFKSLDEVFFEIGALNLRSRKAIERIGASLFSEEIRDSKPHVTYRIDRAGFNATFKTVN